MIPQVEVEDAKLIWRSVGERPATADFEGEDASAWPTGAEAVRQAVKQQAQHSASAEEPWIRVGEVIYDPAQIRKLHQAETDQRLGEDEGMPGDEPWE